MNHMKIEVIGLFTQVQVSSDKQADTAPLSF